MLVDQKEVTCMSAMETSESTNAPNEYPNHAEETIKCIENSMGAEAFQGYLKGNVLERLLRHRYEYDKLEDLKQARWYLDKLIESIQNDMADRFDP